MVVERDRRRSVTGTVLAGARGVVLFAGARPKRSAVVLLVLLVVAWAALSAGNDQPATETPGQAQPAAAGDAAPADTRAAPAALREAVEKAAAVPSLVVSSEQLGLRLTYWPSGTLLANQEGRSDALIDDRGRRWQRSQRCWTRDGSAPAPRPTAALLPMSAKATWGKASGPDGKRTWPFDASTFGSWGPGSGTVTVSAGRIVAFTYLPSDGTPKATFRVYYPAGDSEPPSPRPAC